MKSVSNIINYTKAVIRRILPTKGSALTAINILNLLNPSTRINSRFFKPDLVIKRSARDITRISNRSPMDYETLTQCATDILIASKKAINERDSKRK
jgi:hypothetical protein